MENQVINPEFAAAMTSKEMREGARNIRKMTKTLGQVCKCYEGLYRDVCVADSKLTVEDWMEKMGVPRFVAPNGKKKGYTPGLILGAWHPKMKKETLDGKVHARIFKNVKAVYTDANGAKYDVFTKDEAAKRVAKGGNNGAPIKCCTLVDIPTEGWSIDKIDTGLMQKFNYPKFAKTVSEDAEAWRNVEECYIVTEKEDGERVMELVAKSDVTF